jgi:hypothetical protein
MSNRLQRNATERNVGSNKPRLKTFKTRFEVEYRWWTQISRSCVVFLPTFTFSSFFVRNPRISLSRYCIFFQITLEVKWGSGCVNRPPSIQIWYVCGITLECCCNSAANMTSSSARTQSRDLSWLHDGLLHLSMPSSNLARDLYRIT